MLIGFLFGLVFISLWVMIANPQLTKAQVAATHPILIAFRETVRIGATAAFITSTGALLGHFFL